ncbi:MAG: hypothetical protein QOI12_2479 [Alphaproteobacteria bacterium]|nr:hypothetical protein [Alphaproteobacteria bacterium]
MKRLLALILLLVASDSAVAQTIPLPRPRPAPATDAPKVEAPAPPSACRLRLTEELAVAPSLPPIEGPGDCGAPDVVRLVAVVLADGSRVALTPPATLRCGMAEAIVRWVREDVAAAVHDIGGSLRSVDNYASFDCRGRNNIVGAKTSEHGKGNALDIRSFKLADGKVVKLADPQAAKDFRDRMKKSVCARFSTVLGPGSDGYHEDHIHVDLMDRAPGRFRMCQWDVHDPEPAETATAVPLPPPRPKIEAKGGRKL